MTESDLATRVQAEQFVGVWVPSILLLGAFYATLGGA